MIYYHLTTNRIALYPVKSYFESTTRQFYSDFFHTIANRPDIFPLQHLYNIYADHNQPMNLKQKQDIKYLSDNIFSNKIDKKITIQQAAYVV